MKAILIYSGGLDSTVLLYYLLNHTKEVCALSVDYGQRHRKELDAATAICLRAGVEHERLELPILSSILTGSALTDDISVPTGAYEKETMKLTVVPNRNMILLALATGWAISKKADVVAYAAHSGDHNVYWDCRSKFTDAMDNAIQLCDEQQITLLRPFVNMTKKDLVELGFKLGVPFELTWSCYQGNEKHCGKCSTCLERREAFTLAGVEDPTEYAG